MKNKGFILVVIALMLFSNFSISQNATGRVRSQITALAKVNPNNYNRWYAGLGVQHIFIHADLRNFGVNDNKGEFSYGFYGYGGYMFNSIIGLEAKVHFNDIYGEPQQWSDTYDVRYTPLGLNEVYFKGESIGVRLLGVFNLSNIAPSGKRYQRKWNFAFYAGLGYHQYSSKLYSLETDEVLSGPNFQDNELRGDWASSWYLPVEFGVSYRINRRVDIEFRPALNINHEDDLDAAISDKQNFELFFTTSLGAVYKFGNKRKHLKWTNPYDEALIEIGDGGNEFEVKDIDGDGVIDELDKDNYTPKGVKVYGDGTSIDSDQDQTPDYKDKCPFKKGKPYLEGCPPTKDTDGDSVFDDVDDCPTIPGPKSNNGCPTIPESVLKELNYIAKNIYFETARAKIKPRSFGDLTRIADILQQFPNVRFYIDGHTDNVGNDTYNLALSRRRAAAVVTFLENKGVDGRQLESRGFGESRPIESNSSPGGRQLNRRVEISLIEPDQE